MVSFMQKKILMIVIGIVLLLFVLAKLLISQFCEPVPKNAVVNSAVHFVADAISSPESPQQLPKSDPLSWEPFMRKLASFLASNCPK